MPVMAAVWIEFALLAGVLSVAGYHLCRYGDAIATKTGLGSAWIGVTLMATVTSLPEMVTGISAVTVAAVPDIALGDLLGSCVFNLVLLALADLHSREESLFRRVSPVHLLPGAFGAVLIGLVGLGVLTGRTMGSLGIMHVGLYSPFIVALYLLATRAVYRHERGRHRASVGPSDDGFAGLSLRAVAIRYAMVATVVVAAGVRVPFAAERLAAVMVWEQSFVGTAFVALATSLPEAAVTLAAIRLGNLDMAAANVLGSNLFNILLVAIEDLLYLPGPMLSHVSSAHAVSAVSALSMTAVVMAALLAPPVRVLWRIRWPTAFLLAAFALNLALAFRNER